jgi:hypothetical protein
MIYPSVPGTEWCTPGVDARSIIVMCVVTDCEGIRDAGLD